MLMCRLVTMFSPEDLVLYLQQHLEEQDLRLQISCRYMHIAVAICTSPCWRPMQAPPMLCINKQVLCHLQICRKAGENPVTYQPPLHLTNPRAQLAFPLP